MQSASPQYPLSPSIHLCLPGCACFLIRPQLLTRLIPLTWGGDIPQATRSAALILCQITACKTIDTARGGWDDRERGRHPPSPALTTG
jgi:hypothetical protein